MIAFYGCINFSVTDLLHFASVTFFLPWFGNPKAVFDVILIDQSHSFILGKTEAQHL